MTTLYDAMSLAPFRTIHIYADTKHMQGIKHSIPVSGLKNSEIKTAYEEALEEIEFKFGEVHIKKIQGVHICGGYRTLYEERKNRR